jgi:hypothetical protein
MMRDLLYGGDPEKLSELIWNHGSVLAQYGLVDWNEVPRVNKVFVALFKNRDFERYSLEWGQTVRSDQRAYETVWWMTFKPESVPEEDFRYVYDTYMSGTFWNRGLEILLNDPAFVEAMDFEPGLSIEQFKQQLEQFSTISGDYAEFQRNARQFGYFGPVRGICVVAVVCVAAIAVAFTFTVTTGTVTCTSGSTVVPRVSDMVPGQIGPTLTSVANMSKRIVWVVVKGHTAFRRIPLRPGMTTAQLGLCRVEGILAGTADNDIQEVIDARGRHRGNYAIEPVEGQTVTIRLTDGEAGEVRVERGCAPLDQGAKITAAEALKHAWVGASFDVLSMDNCSAVVPANLNFERVFRLIASESRHDRMLKLALTLGQARESTLGAAAH